MEPPGDALVNYIFPNHVEVWGGLPIGIDP